MSAVIWATVLVSALIAGWRGWRLGTESFQQLWDVAQPTPIGRRSINAGRARRANASD